MQSPPLQVLTIDDPEAGRRAFAFSSKVERDDWVDAIRSRLGVTAVAAEAEANNGTATSGGGNDLQIIT